MQACITLPNHFAFFFPFTHNPMHDYAPVLKPLSESMSLLNQRLIALLRLRSVGVGLGKPDCTTKTPLSELQVSLAVPEIHPCARPPLSPDSHPRLSGREGPELRLSSWSWLRRVPAVPRPLWLTPPHSQQPLLYSEPQLQSTPAGQSGSPPATWSYLITINEDKLA